MSTESIKIGRPTERGDGATEPLPETSPCGQVMEVRMSRRSNIGPYAIVPEWLLYSVSANAIKVWCILARYANTEDVCWPKQETIAEQMGVSLETVRRAVRELVAFDAVRVGKKHLNDMRRVNEYFLDYTHPQEQTDFVGTQLRTSDYSQVRAGDHSFLNKNESQKNESQQGVDLPEKVSPALWAEWEQHRKELRKPITPTCKKKQLAFLAKQSDPDACIQEAIRNGWQGLFPTKNGKPDQKTRRTYLVDTGG